MTHFLLDCSYFKNNFDSVWNKLKLKIAQSNQTDGVFKLKATLQTGCLQVTLVQDFYSDHADAELIECNKLLV